MANNLNIRSVVRHKLTLEDLEVGVGSVEQARDGKILTLTKINAKNLLFDENRTVGQRLDEVEANLKSAENYLKLINDAINSFDELKRKITAAGIEFDGKYNAINLILDDVKVLKAQVVLLVGQANAILYNVQTVETSARNTAQFLTTIQLQVETTFKWIKEAEERIKLITNKVDCAQTTLKALVTEAKQYAEEARKIRPYLRDIANKLKDIDKIKECAEKACQCATEAKNTISEVQSLIELAKKYANQAENSNISAKNYYLACKDILNNVENLKKDLLLSGSGAALKFYDFENSGEYKAEVLGKLTSLDWRGDELILSYEDGFSVRVNDENQIIIGV